MQDVPINLMGYTLRVTEPPTVKTRQLENGELEPVTNRDGVLQFVVVCFAKPKAVEGQRQGKGAEIRVNLGADPGDGFTEGMVVELVNPLLNTYEIPDRDNPRLTASSGLWFKADGLKPAAASTTSSAAYAASGYSGDES
ncbi:hypothetical protein [Amycolatopsis sp. H20-H5]|uniref:hypothetical protein n=1 Tax=Amycolatopsis sp. H20-H5 TaxID=3046309 RepID=UPI002DB57B06|nr:hypothetical protein [Amycolatopsis sp. H20-H5]MEC3974866.1 hypothetical protein [Amycolatopsis sp. H20-H5]